MDAADSGSPSTGSADEQKEDDGWENVEPDVDDRTFKSLFDEKWFDDITEMFKHDKEKHDFDYVRLKNQHSRCICCPVKSCQVMLTRYGRS